MNTLDIILLVLLLIAAVAGWRKGIIVQACGIAGLVLGILFAMRFSRTIGGWLGAGEELSPVLGFVGDTRRKHPRAGTHRLPVQKSVPPYRFRHHRPARRPCPERGQD